MSFYNFYEIQNTIYFNTITLRNNEQLNYIAFWIKLLKTFEGY